MGLMNRVKNRSVSDVKNDTDDKAGMTCPSKAELFGISKDETLQTIRGHIEEIRKDSVFSMFDDTDWNRLQATPVYFCTEDKYTEGTKGHGSRTPHLKIDRDDMTGYVHNFKLGELNGNPAYQYGDKEKEMLCAYNRWKAYKIPVIYIIRQNLNKQEKESGIAENKLLTYFICYEISRALLQVSETQLVINDDKEQSNDGISEVCTVFMRTAVSSGMALYMCKRIYDDVEDIIQSLKVYQPLDFQTGCQYIGHDEALARDIEDWKAIQKSGSADYLDIYKWFSKSIGDKSLAKDPVTIQANWPQTKKLRRPDRIGRMFACTENDLEDNIDSQTTTIVSPISLNSNNINYDYQKALVDFNEKRETGDAIEAVRYGINSGLADFLNAEVEKKLARLDNSGNASGSSVNYLLSNIPIYLVLSNMCGKYTFDGHLIPSDTHYTYNLSWSDFRAMFAEGKFDYFDEPRFRINRVLAWYWHDSDPQEIKDFQDILEHRRIFLYLDNIRDYARDNKLDFSKTLMVTLYHELGHALMDEYNQLHKVPFIDFAIDKALGKNNSRIKENAAKFMYTLREESLANGLAIYLLRNSANVGAEDFYKIRQAEEQKSIPYSLGISYSEQQSLQTSVPVWMRIKKSPFGAAYANFCNWIQVVSNGPFIPWSELQPVENSLG